VSLALVGCESVTLYDAEKAALATGAETKYKDVKLNSLIEVEEQNLDKLLAAELDAIRANHQLRFEIATLRMAADNTVSIGDWYLKADQDRKDLGFPTNADVLVFLDDQDSIRTARNKLLFRKRMMAIDIAAPPPACKMSEPPPDKLPPKTWAAVEALPEGDAKGFLQIDYDSYRKDCKTILEKSRLTPKSGLLLAAFNDWHSAQAALNARQDRVSQSAQAVAEARADYNKAVKDAQPGGSGTTEKVQETANKLANAIADASKAADSVGFDVLPKEQVESITTILKAIASGEVNEDAIEQPQLASAALIAKSLQSLAGEMEALIAQARAPSVSNLLIELQHQVVLMEYAGARRKLAQRRVDLYKGKYAALIRQAEFGRDFQLQLCNFSVLQNGGSFPGANCDQFAVSGGGLNSDGELNVTCQLVDDPVGPPCPLRSPWNVALKLGAGFKVGAKRALYSAVAAFARLQEARMAASESEFKLVDLDHREAIAGNRAAIAAWNNLIVVPIDQLAAYYKSGIKPAEIADLIIKAIGFSAVAGAVAAQ
jgi:hypothetical protein